MHHTQVNDFIMLLHSIIVTNNAHGEKTIGEGHFSSL